MLYYACYNLFNRLNICILDMLLHMRVMTRHLYFLLNTFLKMDEHTETCSCCTCLNVYINKIQQDATLCRYLGVIYCKITLHISGVHRTHHQEYIKL